MAMMRALIRVYPELQRFQFPNWGSVLGSTAPVVTTLLSGISTASFIASLQNSFKSVDIIFFSLKSTSGDIVVVLGILAIAFFITTTILLIQAQASNFDMLSREQQERIFTSVGVVDNDRERIRSGYEERTNNLRIWANLIVTVGLAVLALTLGALLYGYMIFISSAMGLASLVLAYYLFTSRPRPRHIISGIILGIISIAFIISTVHRIL